MTTPSESTPDVLVVGSGLMGAGVARLLRDALPAAHILMADGGPVLGKVAGQHLHETDDPQLWERYNERTSIGIQAFYTGPEVAVDMGGSVAGVEPGMYNLAGLGESAAELPGAALAWNAGGMGIHWSAATPAPWGSEVPAFLDAADWARDLDRARRLLHVHPAPYVESPLSRGIIRALNELFEGVAAEGRQIQHMPMAINPAGDGTLEWTGPSRIFPPIGAGGDPRFTLWTDTQVVELLHEGTRVRGARLRSTVDGTERIVEPRVTIVCADTIRTPQLLYASRIRPPALGRYLNEHAFLTSRVLVDLGRLGCRPSDVPATAPGEWTVGSYWLPHSDSAQPFHGQIMDRVFVNEDGSYLAYASGISLYVPTDIRPECRLEFSATELDATGLPRITARFGYTEADLARIEQARVTLRRMAERLGEFDPATDSALLSPGSSLHFTGTVRMGEVDDGTSVCDPDCRVWGFDNLYVAGNGVVPTALACNSTLTGMVTAVRAARAIAGSVA